MLSRLKEFAEQLLARPVDLFSQPTRYTDICLHHDRNNANSSKLLVKASPFQLLKSAVRMEAAPKS